MHHSERRSAGESRRHLAPGSSRPSDTPVFVQCYPFYRSASSFAFSPLFTCTSLLVPSFLVSSSVSSFCRAPPALQKTNDAPSCYPSGQEKSSVFSRSAPPTAWMGLCSARVAARTLRTQVPLGQEPRSRSLRLRGSTSYRAPQSCQTPCHGRVLHELG